MKRLKAFILMFLVLIMLAGCGQKEPGKEVTAVTILKDGTIESTVVDTFKEYYDEAGLTEQIDTDVSQFNDKAGEEKIKLESLDFAEGSVSMKLKFSDAESYSSFNRVEFFAGTVAEAYDAGYSMDIQMKNVAAEGEGMGKSELLASGDMYMVISEEPILVRTFKNIGYTSENVTLIGKKEAMPDEDSSTPAYILFK